MLTNLNNLHRPCWPRNRVCLCQAVSIPHMGREPFSNHFHNVSSPNPPWNVYIGIGCPRLQKSRFVRLSPFPACNTLHYYRGSKRALLRLSLQRAWPCAKGLDPQRTVLKVKSASCKKQSCEAICREDTSESACRSSPKPHVFVDRSINFSLSSTLTWHHTNPSSS